MSTIPYALKPGAVIAGYDIVRVLGAGGFGITYEAASAITGKRVAIKEFFPRGIASRDSATKIVFDDKENEVVSWALKRFESSTTDQCKLHHPNIVEVLHYVKDNGTGYMIMEYVEGQTLEQWLRERNTAPTPDELRPLVTPILNALHYLHKQHLIHRDIAPDNIMIRPDGKPMIIDFGALKLIEQQTQVRSKTNRSFMVSKQFYSPPEQMDGDGQLDMRADIYSMAATLYRAFAGRPPANADDRTQKLARKKDDPYMPLATVAPGIDAKIAAAIDKSMAFDADDRPRSIEEFVEMLGWTEQQPTILAPRPAENAKPKTDDVPRQMPLSMAPKAQSPLRWLLPLGGVAAVIAIVLLAVNPFGAKSPEMNIAQQKPEVVTPPPVAPKPQVKPEPEKAPPPRIETPVAPPKVEAPPPAAPKSDSLENARRDFEAVQRVNTMQAYEQFLQQYPDGLYATLAREAVKRLAMLDAAKLNRALNAELKRVGCGTGDSDAQWGDDSERALSLFNQYAQTKLNTKVASTDALDAVRSKSQRVCPLVCGPNQRAQGNTCVAIAPPNQKDKKKANQENPGKEEWCLHGQHGSNLVRCGFTTQASCLAARSLPTAPCVKVR